MNYLRVKNLLSKIMSFIFNIIYSRYKVYYITEATNWAIKDVGKNLKKTIIINNYLTLTSSKMGLRDSIIHYGTEGIFFDKNRINLPHKSNKVIVTWFHIIDDDKKLAKILEVDSHVDLFHTSCNITKDKLIKYGIKKEKIKMIPLGINLDIYKPLTAIEVERKRVSLNIPSDAIVIGSFQKDGVGWGEGIDPKMEKGPDIFCDVIEKLSKKYTIFVLLTGPARGYVKNRLEKIKVKYFHEFLDKPENVVDYFQLCDMYIISSREEGGPKAVLESMACGIPLISTKVGMSPDVIEDGKNGYLCDIEDVEDIVKKCELLINNKDIKTKIIENGLKKIVNYEQIKISQDYIKMYDELK